MWGKRIKCLTYRVYQNNPPEVNDIKIVPKIVSNSLENNFWVEKEDDLIFEYCPFPLCPSMTSFWWQYSKIIAL